MQLTIRVKQIAAVTAIVGLAVVSLSVLHVTRLARLGLHESQARGELLANAIFHRVRQVVTESPDPYLAIRTDPGLLALLQSSIYGESVTDAVVTDTAGVVVADSDGSRAGQRLPARPDLAALVSAPALDQLQVIYARDTGTHEVRLPMMLDDQAFGSIRIGVSTLLLREELNAALRPALITAGIALGVAVLLAALLAQLFLRPIHVLRSGLTRLGQGEFGVTLDLPPGDEFGELGSFFNAVSQQLSEDRSQHAGRETPLQTAVENLEDAVALVNPAGLLLFVNPAMQRETGARAAGQPLADVLAADHPYRRLVEATLETRRSQGPEQTHVPAPAGTGGEDRLLITHAIAGADGGLVGVLLVARNLSSFARMQSTLAYSRKLVSLGRLTAGIAHEVKNPLNAMSIHLELLRTKIRAADPAQAGPGGALEHVNVIEAEVRRLDEVVQGFLKFTRPDDLRLQPVRVGALVQEILPVVRPEVERRGVTIDVACADTTSAVHADESMLRQALLNLAINACQAMPDGGTLRIACADAPRGRVEIRVADTGVGISQEHLGRIFDLYFTTKEQGTGLGLSMVYRIV
ncbi:MAG: PAS domain-containing sensor histidine kinase, partial [Vicinamibacterales bacterium]